MFGRSQLDCVWKRLKLDPPVGVAYRVSRGLNAASKAGHGRGQLRLAPAVRDPGARNLRGSRVFYIRADPLVDLSTFARSSHRTYSRKWVSFAANVEPRSDPAPRKPAGRADAVAANSGGAELGSMKPS